MEIITMISVLIGIIIYIFFRECFTSIFSLPRLIFNYWFVNIVLAILFIDSYDWSIFAFLFIYSLCLSFGLGYMIPKKSIRIHENSDKFFNVSMMKRILILSIILGVCNFYTQLLFYGFSIGDMLSFKSLLALNNNIAIERYSNNAKPNLLSQLLLPFVYLSSLLGGYLYPFVARKKEKLLSQLSIIPSLLLLLVLNTKAVIISSLILWISAFTVAYYKLHHSYLNVSKKEVVKYILWFSCFLLLLMISMMLRIGEFDVNTFLIVKNKFASYAIGHMAAFDNWFINNISNLSLNFGAMTFLALSDLIGLHVRIQGIFSDFFYTEGITTNVYTALRPLVMDYGIIGSILVFFFLGIIMNLCIKNIFSQNIIISSLSEVILISFYSYTLYGFIASMFSYSSYLVMWVLMIIILILVKSGNHRQEVIRNAKI